MSKVDEGKIHIEIENFEGLDGFSSPIKIKKESLTELENFRIQRGDLGSLVKRGGFGRYNPNQYGSVSKPIMSMFEARFQSGTKLLLNNDNDGSSVLSYVAEPYSSTFTAITGANGVSMQSRLRYAMIRDRVYICNRTDGTDKYNNSCYDGTNYTDAGCPPPNSVELNLAGSTSGGNVSSSSQYSYAVSFLYNDNQESQIMGFKSFTTGGSDNAVLITTIPTAPINGVANPRITGRKLYRTKAGAGVFYFLAVIPNNTDTSYTDQIGDSFLSEPIDMDLRQLPNTPQNSEFMTVHKDRLVLGNIYNNFYKAPDGANITLTGSETGGSLGSGVYKYRFYLSNVVKTGATSFQYLLSKYVEKTIDLTSYAGTNNSVTIDWSALTANNWFNRVWIERTAVGGSDFLPIRISSSFGTGSYLDTNSDANRFTILGSDTVVNKSTDTQTQFSNLILISDAEKPDLFTTTEYTNEGLAIPSGNEFTIDEEITGLFSEQNRIIIFSTNNIYELDTTAQSRLFWRINKVVNGIGGAKGGIVKTANGYVFVSLASTSKDKIIFYEWNGQGQPEVCSSKIQTYINTLNIAGNLTVRDMCFYAKTNRVCTLINYTDDLSTSRTYLFEYDMNFRDSYGWGNWFILKNDTTDLAFYSLYAPSNTDMLIGSNIGYINYENLSTYRDSIGATPTNTTFTAKLKTKTFQFTGDDIMLRRVRGKTEGNGTATMTIKYFLNGVSTSDTLQNTKGDTNTVVNGFFTFDHTKFTGQTGRVKNIAIQLEHTANTTLKMHGLDISVSQEGNI